MSKTKAMTKQMNPSQTQQENTRIVTAGDIALRAYAIYQRRQGEDGHDMEDWLQAERELLQEQLSATEKTVVY